MGVVGQNGPQSLVFEGPDGALQATPEALTLPAEATALALGQLDESFEMDLAVAAGNELLIVHGRDRKLSLDETRQAEVKPAVVDSRAFSFSIRSIALGDFISDEAHRTDIAVLADDGTLHVLTNPNRSGVYKGEISVGVPVSGHPRLERWTRELFANDKAVHLPANAHRAVDNAGAHRGAPRQASVRGLNEWLGETLTTDSWPQATQLVRAKVSSLPTDDLVILDQANHQPHILSSQQVNEARGQRDMNSLTH